MDTGFLKSNRFWALVVLAVVMWFNSQGFIAEGLFDAFIVVLGGHIGLRTLDRATEKLGAGRA